MRINLFCVALLSILVSCSSPSGESEAGIVAKNKFSDPIIRQIYDFQNSRKSDSLFTFLQSEQSEYRKESALAFASIQDTLAISKLIPLLADSEVKVRKVAAYSLGQIGHLKAEKALITRVKEEPSEEVTAVLLEAIGKCASTESVSFLSSFYGQKKADYGVSAGLFRASLKGETSESGLARIIELLQPTQHESTRIVASTYLARNRKQKIDKYLKAITHVLRNDNSEFVRMNCAMALRQAVASDVKANLMDALNLDESELVKISAIRALSSLKIREASALVSKQLTSNQPNLALAASDYFTTNILEEDIPKLEEKLGEVANWRVRANLLASLIKLKPETKGKVLEMLNKSSNDYEKGALLVALANHPDNYEYIKERLYSTQSTVVKTYAIEALSNIRKNPDFESLQEKDPDVEKNFAEYFKYAIESKDIALIYYAAILLRDPDMGFKNVYQSGDFLVKTMKQLKLPIDIEAYQELEKTAIYFGLEIPQRPEEENSVRPIDWEWVSKIDKNAKLKLQTSKGKIVWQLFVEDAPATVAEITQLAHKGFYNGKNFHRIVPNFVAQGGCPRGDGFGGLPYSIKSEFAALSYEQGMVGMASAGKDTESCQWFITHNPTPHLDGRYTIFATTVEGMKVVQKLEIGDEIEKMSLIVTDL